MSPPWPWSPALAVPCFALALLLPACCRNDQAPAWSALDPVHLDEDGATLDLDEHVADDRGEIEFEAVVPYGIIGWIEGGVLHLQPQPDWEGSTVVTLTALDRCGNEATAELEVTVGAEPGSLCPVTLTYAAQGDPDSVSLAGSFNDWDPEATEMTAMGDGTWSVTLEVEPGAYPYKLVETIEGFYEDERRWACDPQAPFIQCDAGYKSPDETDWSQDCSLDAPSCNSLLVVRDCALPVLSLDSLSIDREGAGVSATVSVEAGAGGATIYSAGATLDGEAIDGAWDGVALQVSLTGLDRARHTLRFHATDALGNEAEELYVPFWLDGRTWNELVLYYAFVDRLVDGDTGLDSTEGTEAEIAGYMGGDWQGLLDLLPYLEDLGVTALWITNPQDNAEGAWSGDCDTTYAGYHGYWPDDPTALEEHFGDEDLLRAVIDDAHGRGMRVVMDWVVNHVHEDHPYYQEHADEWFNDQAICDDGDNWNDIPETCWFAPYLPDIDYYEPEPLARMVDDALLWIRAYELDGLRVDGAKHVPHSVHFNLASRIAMEVEHADAGGDEEFWVVGETFDWVDRIAEYVGEDQLDGQFDFPLYWAVLDALAYESTDLAQLFESAASYRESWGDALMSGFLGNHDVERFVTITAGESADVCGGDPFLAAEPPGDAGPYQRLMLAWTFLFTQPGIPLVYYGDEMGLPGHGDPDNRHPLWWYTGDLSGDGGPGVDEVAAVLGDEQAAVLRHVAALARARADHPAFWSGDETEWWRDPYDAPSLYAFARVAGDDAVLVVLNRSDADATLGNSLEFAGLLAGATYVDVLTGDTFGASGDWLSFDVAARGSRVLVQEEGR